MELVVRSQYLSKCIDQGDTIALYIRFTTFSHKPIVGAIKLKLAVEYCSLQ